MRVSIRFGSNNYFLGFLVFTMVPVEVLVHPRLHILGGKLKGLAYIDSECFSYIVPMVPMCLSNAFLKFISYALQNLPT